MKEQMLRELSARRSVLFACYIATIIFYGLAILMLLYDIRTAVLMVGLTTLFYFLFVRWLNHSYNIHFARTSLLLGTGRDLDVPAVSPKGSVSRQDLQRQELLPLPRGDGGVVAGLELRGKAPQGDVTLCELTSNYQLPEDAARKVGFLHGVWFSLRYQREGSLRLVLVHKALLDPSICPRFYLDQGYHAIPVLDRALEGRYLLFGKTEQDGRAAHRFAQSCLPLLQKAGTPLGIQLGREALHVFLAHRALSFNTPLRERLTLPIISGNYVPEWEPMLHLADLYQGR